MPGTDPSENTGASWPKVVAAAYALLAFAAVWLTLKNVDSPSLRLIGACIALSLGLILALWRGRAATGFELALYWLGAVPCILFLFINVYHLLDDLHMVWKILPRLLWRYAASFFIAIGGLIVVGSAAYIVWHRWRILTRTELAIYLIGIVLATLVFAVVHIYFEAHWRGILKLDPYYFERFGEVSLDGAQIQMEYRGTPRVFHEVVHNS